MLDTDFIIQITTGTIIGLAAGYLGAYMVLRRMSLVGDALSHVALPGIAIALSLNINPFIGAFCALFLAIVGVWSMERKSQIPSETLIGIIFTLSLAIGILVTPDHEMLEALFGDISKVTVTDLIISAILVIAITAIMHRIGRGLIISIISKDLARSMGLNYDRINLAFLTSVAIIVALGLKIAGTVLMGSLVIIPAAAARNIAKNLSRYNFWSGFIGALSAFSGIYFARVFNLSPGPIVVLSSGAVFMISLLFKQDEFSS